MFDLILLLLICQMNLHLTFFSLHVHVELDLIGTTCGIYLQLITVIVHLLKQSYLNKLFGLVTCLFLNIILKPYVVMNLNIETCNGQ